jgi:PAS domain S-box-containing protein
MITGQGDERIAVQAIQHGAYDYLVKTGDYLSNLPALIKKAIELSELTLSIERSNEQIRYQSVLLNNMRDAVVVWNMNGEITFWNPAAYILFGANPKDRIGKPVGEVYLETFDPPVQTPRLGATSGQEVERVYQTTDRGAIWISSRVMILYDPNDNMRPLGYMDVSRDITRRKIEQQALFESEARYRAIVEDYQTEMICRFLQNGKLTFVNETYCQYYGQNRDELLGGNFLDYQDPVEHPATLQHLHALSPEKPVQTIQFQIHKPDGSPRWQEWTNRAIYDETQRFVEFQSVGRDITDRKKMEMQIQVAQTHLAQAARLSAIGELASSVAHLINNPLTTVIAEAQMLIQEHRDDPAMIESAQAIEQAGWRAQQVIQQLLEFSAPNQEIQESFDVNETIQKAINLVSPPIIAMGVSIQTDLLAIGSNVCGNPRQIEDLWVNLLLSMRDNLADGIPHTLTIRSYFTDTNLITVEIVDDGNPIPMDQLETIFEPNLISPVSGRGTGMELAICREIVRQHNGKINAVNIPNQGTMFRVEFPAEG